MNLPDTMREMVTMGHGGLEKWFCTMIGLARGPDPVRY